MSKETLLYDIVHDYILSEGFASDTEGANKVILKLSDELMQEIYERTMTASEKRKDTMLKKKYDDSDMKKNMQGQYGKEEGKKVYFATIRKQAMKKEEVEQEENPSIKAKMKRQAMIKKQVLMKKLQAVRAGAGADITSSYKPDGEILQERQKTNQGHRQSEEQHRSDYGKASIRNVRAVGYGGNAASPEERKKAHNERMKKHMTNKGKSMIDPKKNPVTEEVGIGLSLIHI